MATLDELLEKRSPKSRERISARAEQLRQEHSLAKLREELNISQEQLANTLGIKQPAVVKMEKVSSDPKISTLKRYIEGMGGELSLEVKLPDGKRIALSL
ncbi:hypothetical protein R84981_001364 [Carnimonas sp. R-84981]|uniref:helix-turn-helix domain-containing protein n=1 Tax=Carnimonas bestiolae TaxID=3402172 RepID=UPI003EDC1F6B